MTDTSLRERAIKRWGGIEGQPRAFHQKENGDCSAYVTISADGIKPEGQAMESRLTAAQAVEDLFEHIESYLGEHLPIWRQSPQVSQDGERFYATARLVRGD